jgi:hypothetical protein
MRHAKRHTEDGYHGKAEKPIHSREADLARAVKLAAENPNSLARALVDLQAATDRLGAQVHAYRETNYFDVATDGVRVHAQGYTGGI